MNIRECVLLAFLGLNTISDIRTKKVLIWSAWVFGVFGLLYGLLTKELVSPQVITALLPGSICLIISKVTKESMGYGDGIIILVMGVYISTQKLIGSLVLALIFAALWSILLLVLFRKKKQDEFPFVPFVLLGYIGGMLF